MAREDGLEPSTSCSRDKRFTDSTTPECGCLDSIRTNTARAKIWCPTLRRQGNGADTKNRTLRMRKHRRFTVSTVSIAGYISIWRKDRDSNSKRFYPRLFSRQVPHPAGFLPLVGEEGLEPSRPNGHMLLRHAWLPITPFSQSFKMQIT